MMLACLLLACCGSGEWHACRGGERARRCGVLVRCIARSTERRQRARAAATRHLCFSYRHVYVNAMLLMRVPVHGVGESDRPSQVYGDMKYIFCEYSI